MTHKEYNGWTNYEMWLVKLWMDNEEGSYRFWEERADEYGKDSFDNLSPLADELKEHHQEALPELRGFAADLMNAALSEVNWFEIAKSLLNDAKERVTK